MPTCRLCYAAALSCAAGLCLNIRLVITIGRDIDTVWSALADPRRRRDWQPGLMAADVVSGVPGETGNVNDLVYDENGREVRVREHVVDAERPSRLLAEYESEQASTTASNRLSATGDDGTRLELECRVRFRGLLARLMAVFMKGAIRRRIESDMERLKSALEGT